MGSKHRRLRVALGASVPSLRGACCLFERLRAFSQKLILTSQRGFHSAVSRFSSIFLSPLGVRRGPPWSRSPRSQKLEQRL